MLKKKRRRDKLWVCFIAHLSEATIWGERGEDFTLNMLDMLLHGGVRKRVTGAAKSAELN